MPSPLPFLISFQKPVPSITGVTKDSSGGVKYHEQVGGSPLVICNQGGISEHFNKTLQAGLCITSRFVGRLQQRERVSSTPTCELVFPSVSSSNKESIRLD